MPKKIMYALLLLGLAVILLIFNTQKPMDLNLVFFHVSAAKALILFGFLSLGIAVGLLLR